MLLASPTDRLSIPDAGMRCVALRCGREICHADVPACPAALVPWVLGADLLGDGFMLDLTCAAQYRSLVQLADIIVLPLSCVILGLGVCASSVPEALLCVHVRPPSRGLDRSRLVLRRKRSCKMIDLLPEVWIVLA